LERRIMFERLVSGIESTAERLCKGAQAP
jgi:hypothetical protein